MCPKLPPPSRWVASSNDWVASPNDWVASPNEWVASPNDWVAAVKTVLNQKRKGNERKKSRC